MCRVFAGALLIALFGVLMSACNGESTGESEPTETIESFDDPFDEVVLGGEDSPVRLPVLPPLSFEEVIHAGVQAGSWTEVEGLIKALELARAGEAAAFSDVMMPELTGVVRRAQELVGSADVGVEEEAELGQLLALITPPIEFRDAIEARFESQAAYRLAGFPDLRLEDVLAQTTSPDCSHIDLAWFTDDLDVGVECYLVITASTGADRQRVFYPAVWQQTAAMGFVEAALEAMVRSHEVFSAFGNVGSADLVFSLSDNAETDLAAVPYFDLTQPCPITVYPVVGTQAELGLQQTVAHEIFHCYQEWNMETRPWEANRWYMESAADYFSNVVYPSADLEHARLEYFDRRSKDRPLWAMTYEIWVWWQYLANMRGDAYLIDLHDRMSRGSESPGGVSVMSAEPGIAEDFQQFVVNWITTGIQDPGGELVKGSEFSDSVDVGSSGGRRFETDGFVASRYLVFYEPEREYSQVDVSNPNSLVDVADASASSPAWGRLPEFLVAPCDRAVALMVVATSVGRPSDFAFDVSNVNSRAQGCNGFNIPEEAIAEAFDDLGIRFVWPCPRQVDPGYNDPSVHCMSTGVHVPRLTSLGHVAFIRRVDEFHESHYVALMAGPLEPVSDIPMSPSVDGEAAEGEWLVLQVEEFASAPKEWLSEPAAPSFFPVQWHVSCNPEGGQCVEFLRRG